MTVDQSNGGSLFRPLQIRTTTQALRRVELPVRRDGAKVLPVVQAPPGNSLNVQHIFDEATPGGEDNGLVGVRCLACSDPAGEPHDRAVCLGTGRASNWLPSRLRTSTQP